ncbi:hypothetical protein HanRHA438_Chr06g0287261 [Helianthus annuus]|uniref:Uncharacterized protein n=1 Tax=Helianthus annuus TaxID=4232 RepID=A0A9K3NKV5_HELAN|nr:hypothetical protein HanXRQr2_Chr06g0278031 [Helianthus annuus]KAJ0913585.1 hypothetical protein HanRHA438_Chr06g0287261 [Helianthus annuus]KAJ0917059.1 hypothetical protein HanPSC8_Chr06g0268971 [Helianthus annuus]
MLPDSPEKPVNHRSSVGEPSSPKFTSRVVTFRLTSHVRPFGFIYSCVITRNRNAI